MEGLEPSKTTAKMQWPSLVYSLYDITSAPSHPLLHTWLKVHKIENFFDSDFGICVISLLVIHKY